MVMVQKGMKVRVRGDGFLPLDPGAEFIPGGTEGVVDQVNKAARVLLVEFPDRGVVTADFGEAESTFSFSKAPAASAGAARVSETPARAGKEGAVSEKNQTIEMLKDRGFHGGKVAAADEAGEFLLVVARRFLGDAYPGILETDRGQEFAKLFAATGLFYLSTSHPGVIPGAEHVAAACGLQVEAASRDLIQPVIAGLRPALEGLAKIGAATKESRPKA